MNYQREIYRIQEIEGVAEAYSHAVRDEVRFSSEMRGDRMIMRDRLPIKTLNPLFSIVYLASYGLKLGILILGKLNDIHSLLWEQELRERKDR